MKICFVYEDASGIITMGFDEVSKYVIEKRDNKDPILKVFRYMREVEIFVGVISVEVSGKCIYGKEINGEEVIHKEYNEVGKRYFDKMSYTGVIPTKPTFEVY